jgi:hypothetical protein
MLPFPPSVRAVSPQANWYVIGIYCAQKLLLASDEALAGAIELGFADGFRW